MPATLWLDSSGRLIVDADGKPILCEECPCDCPLLDEYAFSGTRTAKYGGLPWDDRTFSGTLTKGENCIYSGSISANYKTYNSDGSVCNTSTENWTFTAQRSATTWELLQSPLIALTAPRNPNSLAQIIGTYEHTQNETVQDYCDWPVGSYDLVISGEYDIS
jgi:hypothetical protein